MTNKSSPPPKCKICDNPTKWNSTYKRFGIYCSSKCSGADPEKKAKQKQTCLDRYGTVNPLLNQEIKQKMIDNNQQSYGVDYYTNPEKRKQTNLTKYNVEYPFQSNDIQQKRKNIFYEKYGVNSPIQHPTFQQKIQDTNIKKYGVDNPLKNIKIREKIKNTLLEKYNISYYVLSTDFINKKRQTLLTKYGVFHYSLVQIQEVYHLLSDYNWLYEQYIILNKTDTEIASELHVDKTTIGNYRKIHNISTILRYGYSIQSILWLESVMRETGIIIQHALNGGEYQIPGTKYKADGYCPETNTIYEFHGDCWHGNPKIFNPDELCHPFSDETAQQLYQKTIERENAIKLLGYNLIVQWESPIE